jgi:hypothetical protein
MLSNLFNALIKRSGLKAERVLMPLDSFVLCMKVLGVYAIQNTTSSREKKMIDTWAAAGGNKWNQARICDVDAYKCGLIKKCQESRNNARKFIQILWLIGPLSHIKIMSGETNHMHG